MPDLTKLPVPEYQANQPYHWKFDNLPLKTLADRDEVINNAVDRQTQILNDAAGSQGSISNRLNQSIDEDGNIKSSAVDESLHNISEHSDGSKVVGDEELDYYNSTLGYSEITNPVGFVRMLESERDKLSNIPINATSLFFEVCTDDDCVPSNIVLFDQGKVRLQSSSLIGWEVGFTPNTLKPVLKTSLEFNHRHYYDIEPVLVDVENNEYDASGNSTAYLEGSLRVYINGTRLSSDQEIYYPKNPTSNLWESSNAMLSGGSNMYTPNHSTGTFTLSKPITEEDIIRVDFDVSLL